MVSYSMLLLPILLLAEQVSSTMVNLGARADYYDACTDIANAIGASSVFYPGDSDYASDIYHHFGSSTEEAACSVDPATAQEVAKVLEVIGSHSVPVPFAVKSGGHSFTRTFSSTEGIQIDLSKFNEIDYDPRSQTVTIGSGQTWGAVYTALEAFGVTCIGARLASVGIGGYLLGGGYGWLSNQRGLGIDNILSYDLVTPNGRVTKVTEATKPDLFLALKGGGNNFGIVTKFTINTFPQGTIWGGTLSFASKDTPAVTEAFAKIAADPDPKASMTGFYIGAVGSPEATTLASIFYDGPSPPPGLYDGLLAIPAVTSSVRSQSLSSLVLAATSSPYVRGLVEQLPVLYYPVDLLNKFKSEVVLMAETMKDARPVWIGYFIEPIAPSLLSHAPPSKSRFPTSAWPPTRDFAITTTAIWLGWNESSQDGVIHKAARESSARIRQTAVDLGQAQAAAGFKDSSIYPNYATNATTAEELYGSNLPLLQKIKKRYDPKNVMGLAGGVKIIGA